LALCGGVAHLTQRYLDRNHLATAFAARLDTVYTRVFGALPRVDPAQLSLPSAQLVDAGNQWQC
jgi:hypothetical protein